MTTFLTKRKLGEFRRAKLASQVAIAIALLSIPGLLIGDIQAVRLLVPKSSPAGELRLDIARPIPTQLSASGRASLTVDPYPGGLDIFVRNVGTAHSHIHSADITVISWKGRPSSAGRALPVLDEPPSFQYQAQWSPGQKEIGLDLAQDVPPGQGDRFQIFIGINPATAIPQTASDTFDMHVAMLLSYDNGREIKSPPVDLTVSAGTGVPSDAGVTLEDHINRMLLDTKLVDVTNLVDAVASVGGPTARAALLQLDSRNLHYLQEEDPKGKLTPAPEDSISQFRKHLTLVISTLNP